MQQRRRKSDPDRQMAGTSSPHRKWRNDPEEKRAGLGRTRRSSNQNMRRPPELRSPKQLSSKRAGNTNTREEAPGRPTIDRRSKVDREVSGRMKQTKDRDRPSSPLRRQQDTGIKRNHFRGVSHPRNMTHQQDTDIKRNRSRSVSRCRNMIPQQETEIKRTRSHSVGRSRNMIPQQDTNILRNRSLSRSRSRKMIPQQDIKMQRKDSLRGIHRHEAKGTKNIESQKTKDPKSSLTEGKPVTKKYIGKPSKQEKALKKSSSNELKIRQMPRWKFFHRSRNEEPKLFTVVSTMQLMQMKEKPASPQQARNIEHQVFTQRAMNKSTQETPSPASSQPTYPEPVNPPAEKGKEAFDTVTQPNSAAFQDTNAPDMEGKASKYSQHLLDFLTSWGDIRAATDEIAKTFGSKTHCGTNASLPPSVMEDKVAPAVEVRMITPVDTPRPTASSSVRHYVAAEAPTSCTAGEIATPITGLGTEEMLRPMEAQQQVKKYDDMSRQTSQSKEKMISVKIVQKAGRRSSRNNLFRRRKGDDNSKFETSMTTLDMHWNEKYRPLEPQLSENGTILTKQENEHNAPEECREAGSSSRISKQSLDPQPVISDVSDITLKEKAVPESSSILADLSNSIKHGTIFYTRVDEVVDNTVECARAMEEMGNTVPSRIIKNPNCFVLEDMGEIVEQSRSIVSGRQGREGHSSNPIVSENSVFLKLKGGAFSSEEHNNEVVDRYSIIEPLQGEQDKEFISPTEEQPAQKEKQIPEYSSIVDDSLEHMSSALEEAATIFYTNVDVMMDVAYPGASKSTCGF